MKIRAYLLATVITIFSGPASIAYAAAPSITAPNADALKEARTLIAKMRENPRGPYSNIQWVCKDGTILPPKAGACSSHGGGNQYAKFSQDRARLAAIGYPVGTIFMAWDAPDQVPDARPFLRLRDLPLEQYLVDIDDGWVLHKARGYRGRVQVEDEEQAGRDLLLSVLANPKRITSDLILLRELVKVIPHAGAGQDPTREIRRLSQVLAERDKAFEPLRAEIHGKPTASTAQRVREWQTIRPPLTGEALALMSDLTRELDNIFGEAGREARLKAVSKSLRSTDPNIAALFENTSTPKLEVLVEGLTKIRTRFDAISDPKAALTYLDAMTTLEAEIIATARTAPPVQSRASALSRARILVDASAALGWLSPTEAEKLITPLMDIGAAVKNGKTTLNPSIYASLIKNLQLAPAWAQGSVKHSFAEPLAKYVPLDPRSYRFIDDVLRGSVLQPLSDVTESLARDDAALSGVQARFMDKTLNAIALNSGKATGVLRVLEVKPDGTLPLYDPTDIIVIPNTTSELFPAAGIVTVGEGNPLSHIQILARNLGIPNIVVDASVQTQLKAYDGKRVNFAATHDGRILMQLNPSNENILAKPKAPTQISRSGTIPAPAPDLSHTSPIPLSGLRANLSGVVVGPKAANIGELAYLFPDRVAPAVALPFGAFAAHTEALPNAPRLKLKAAFKDFDTGKITEDAFLAVLDTVRTQTAALSLQPETRKKLLATLDANLTPGAGLFVRSDTNMEDLPQFTGAGLNLTIANVTGRDKQLAAISEVWASVYTRRAMAWRSQILSNPDDVFSSILLMESVPSEKSGVMVTTDLTGGDVSGALTVSVAWGVGGAVDNESAASHLLMPKSAQLLSEAKAPYQRYLKDIGGVGWKPAQSGPILTPQEITQLRALAKEVTERYPPSLDTDGQALPYDIEFGFARGKLNLLQIRPLVQRGALAAEAAVSAVIPKPAARKPVALNAAMISATTLENIPKVSNSDSPVKKLTPKNRNNSYEE